MADNKYSRGKVYMIESASAGLIYYGSTCNDLYKRMGTHRSDYKRFQAGKYHRVTSFDVLQHPDARIILVETFPCANKQELNAREAHYIRSNNCVNKVIPGRTHAEYCQENKEEISEWMKQYHQENKEEILEKKKQYYQENKANIQEKKKQAKHCQTCNCSVRHDKFSRHTRSKKHIASTSDSSASIVARTGQPDASDNQDEIHENRVGLT